MDIVEHGLYVIDDQFFIDFPDPYLKGNKEENRPHYYCFKEDNTGLYWIIPMSKRSDKYKEIIKKREDSNKRCDILHIIEIAGTESVFLVQDMFPITANYIKKAYTIDGVAVQLKDEMVIKILNKKAKTVLALLRQGKKFMPTQPDVLSIEKSLMKKLNP